MSQKKYWQNFGELNDSEGTQEMSANEFREDLPFVEMDGKGLLDAKTPRRDFLKYVGFSTAAAMVAASCEMPVKKAIPFVNKPENITPGAADYYATTYIQDGDVVPVLAKVRDGRPIKLEGNDHKDSFTAGATSARVQASVLDLYDTARLRYPAQLSGKDFKEISSFENLDKMIGEAMTGIAGTSVVLLTSTINSPSTLAVIEEFKKKYTGARHIQYDAVSYSGMLEANEASYGKRALPSYQFDKAKVIVGLGADFLGTWLSPVEYARQYAVGRKVNEKTPTMSRHIQFESNFSMTGANADDRFQHRPSEAGMVALALLAAIDGSVTAPAIADERLKKGIAKTAEELKTAKGAALVVSGSNDMNLQMVVNAINEAIGANGTTINWAAPVNYRAGIDKDMVALVDAMTAGTVNALLVFGANPAYTYADADKFKAAMAKVKLTVSFNEKLDETTELCKFSVPAHHFLESWGDAEAKTGVISFIQPTIHPLFKTRNFQTSLLKWSGINTDYASFVKDYWIAKLNGQENFDKALQDGVLLLPSANATGSATFNKARLAEAAGKIAAAPKGGKMEVVLYQKVAIGDGKQANNPWLQEMPDPITRATWDNYALISPAYAKELLGIDLKDGGQADDYEVYPEKPVIKIKTGNKEISLPILIMPGVQPNTIAIALGYGRSNSIGKAVVGVGKNAFPLAMYDGNNFSYFAGNVTVEKTSDKYKIARTQTHNSYEGRTEVIKELPLSEFVENRTIIRDEREAELKPFGGIANFEKEGTIYGQYDRPGMKWGMSIDLNSCIGCGACVVACNAENNVSVVGKGEVIRGHEMHWMRIDRYFSGDADNPDVVFQPMLCQHCDNAPCENVCPVAATNHSSEGLNQMTYNRCIGTRYCANNCPYKVRRFNWADYTGSDSFANNQQPLVDEGKMSDVVMMMNDPLSRMVLNPDVTVRSRGVIEKCSFCVQRLQEGKLKAKKENRAPVDGEIKTACMQSCPTTAIVFGDANNKQSNITKVRTEESPLRLFYVLEAIHVLPGINYLAKVRNKEMETAHHKAGEKKHEAAAPAEKHS
jgi:MoCo/4Fe-4S cofactor protein with predicted Tat translocation signal